MSSAIFPGVPRIESPLFCVDALDDLSPDEQRIARSLNENGFATFDFPDPDISERMERIKSNLGPDFDIPLADPQADKTKGKRRIQDAWHFDKDVWALAANAKVMVLLEKLYGRPPFPFQTLNFAVGTQQGAHSDSVHFSSQPERFMCGVWLAMEDIAEENGPLFYVPGTHRWPILSNAMIGRRGFGSELRSAQDPYGPAWKAMIKARGLKREKFLARKGQALIWCANLLHGGSKQMDPARTRWSQVTHYFFEDCIYYTPAFSDESLGKLAVRHLRAVHDGLPRPSQYLGEVVCDPEAPTAPTPSSKPRGIFRRLRRPL